MDPKAIVNIKDQIDQLRHQLRYHEYQYHVLEIRKFPIVNTIVYFVN